MNPNAPHQSFELPVPQPGNGTEAMPSGETPPSRPETQPVPQAPAPSHPLQAQPVAQPVAPVQPIPVSAPVSSSPPIADDNDLIEKEWVEKAKQIVAATREDPFAQNKEMSRFKADYLKKRYNKDIKLEES